MKNHKPHNNKQRMTMLTIYTQIKIDCPIEQVWQVLMDFDSYSKWNSFIKSIEVLNKKPIQPNSQMHVTLNQQAGKTMSFSPLVTNYEPYQSLHWLGKLFVKGIFDGRHQFELEPSKHYANGTSFIHKETFTGILVPFFKRTLNNNTKMRFEEMNVALKQYCESLNKQTNKLN